MWGKPLQREAANAIDPVREELAAESQLGGNLPIPLLCSVEMNKHFLFQTATLPNQNLAIGECCLAGIDPNSVPKKIVG